MSSLVRESSQVRLTPGQLNRVFLNLVERLRRRVEAVYIFGSAATEQYTESSDIDLILVTRTAILPPVQRALDFTDLFEIYPALDLLVYTSDELERQLADSETGFWKSVRLSMRRLEDLVSDSAAHRSRA